MSTTFTRNTKSPSFGRVIRALVGAGQPESYGSFFSISGEIWGYTWILSPDRKKAVSVDCCRKNGETTATITFRKP